MNVRCVAGSYAPVCWQCVGGVVRNVKCVMEGCALMWGGAVMSVRCVMVSHALMWRRSGECEACDCELCTGVMRYDVMLMGVVFGVWCAGQALGEWSMDLQLQGLPADYMPYTHA